MKWIVIAIIAVIIPYTYLTLRYRKPGPAFQPHDDMKNRANVMRLLSAGYQRIPLIAERPADPVRGIVLTQTSPAPGGLPGDLGSTLVDTPLLPAEIVNVAADTTTNTLQPYTIRFSCTLPNDKQQPSGADLYLRGDQIIITPTFERVGELMTRSRDAVVLLTVPAGALKPGSYRVTLTGQRTSRSWPLTVN